MYCRLWKWFLLICFSFGSLTRVFSFCRNRERSWSCTLVYHLICPENPHSVYTAQIFIGAGDSLCTLWDIRKLSYNLKPCRFKNPYHKAFFTPTFIFQWLRPWLLGLYGTEDIPAHLMGCLYGWVAVEQMVLHDLWSLLHLCYCLISI